MNFSVRFEGFDRLKRDLNSLEQRAKTELASAITDVVATTHDEAVQDTPLDKGPLRETSEGRVSGRIISRGSKDGANQVASIRTVGNTFTGVIGYSEEYAPLQHEILFYRHNVGKAKFLEDAAIGREQANVDRFGQAFDKL